MCVELLSGIDRAGQSHPDEDETRGKGNLVIHKDTENMERGIFKENINKTNAYTRNQKELKFIEHIMTKEGLKSITYKAPI